MKKPCNFRGKFCAIKKTGAVSHTGPKRRTQMTKMLPINVYTVYLRTDKLCFDLPHRQVELFRQAVKRDSIKQSSLEDHPVPLCVSANYPIVDGRFNIGPG